MDTKTARLANVDLLIDNKILIIAGVMDGKKGKWVGYPGEKVDNNFHNQVYFLNQNLKTRVETKILEEFGKI